MEAMTLAQPPSATSVKAQDDTSRWKDSKFLIQQLAQARKFVEDCEGHAYQEHMEHLVFEASEFTPPLESVLEGAFCLWWEAMVGHSGDMGSKVNLACQRDVRCGERLYRLDFSVEPTHAFADELSRAGIVWPPIAIEVDGHAFHEKTKEQVAQRNQRDRDLQGAGWKVLHLSYSEVDRDGCKACGDVAQIVFEQFIEIRRKIHARGRS